MKYSSKQVTGFVFKYIIWKLKMASFPTGETKNITRQAGRAWKGRNAIY